MRFNTVLLKYNTCCHDFFSHRLHPDVHYVVTMPRHAASSSHILLQHFSHCSCVMHTFDTKRSGGYAGRGA